MRMSGILLSNALCIYMQDLTGTVNLNIVLRGIYSDQKVHHTTAEPGTSHSDDRHCTTTPLLALWEPVTFTNVMIASMTGRRHISCWQWSMDTSTSLYLVSLLDNKTSHNKESWGKASFIRITPTPAGPVRWQYWPQPRIPIFCSTSGTRTTKISTWGS
jgi:hypothetical protein